MEKYDPNSDVWANRESNRDFTELMLKHQVLSDEVKYKDIVFANLESTKFKNQLIDGFGLKNPFLYLSILGGMYVGGLFQARRQFINGGDFFLNSKFDFVGGRRPIFLGFLGGLFLGSLIVGQPYKVEDFVRAQFIRMKRVPVSERGHYFYRDGLGLGMRVDIPTIFDK